MFNPSDFAGDWYGYLTNQAAHFLLGLVAFAALTWLFKNPRAAFISIAILYAVWEVGQLFLVFAPLDALEDWFFVISGAGFGWLAMQRCVRLAGAVLAAVTVKLTLGVFRRKD